MKKILALLLVMAAVMGVFAGCTGTTSTLPQMNISDEVPYEMDESGRVLDNYFEGVEVDWWFSSSYALTKILFQSNFLKVSSIPCFKWNKNAKIPTTPIEPKNSTIIL